MNRFSCSDWLFAVVLWAAAVAAGVAYFGPQREFWAPVMGALACLVAAAIIVNLYRYWRACAQLRKRRYGN